MAIPGSVVGIGKLVTPGGAQGPIGPTAVSSDPGNIATLGSDKLVLVPQSTIWNQRLRSYNSVGNPNFEVSQRNIGSLVTNPAHGTLIEDRWAAYNNGSLNPFFQKIAVSTMAAGNGIDLPGTSFAITTAYFRVSCGTVKASLAAGDVVGINQTIEGPYFRELKDDVHSVTLMVRSSVANLSFGLSLRDPTGTRSLTKLCTLGAANTTSLITLPNLPAWPSAGTFTAAPGAAGYSLNIILSSGATYMSPANDTWQNGNFMGATGQNNFISNPVNSTFDVMFVQHEPGPLCTTPMDKPFNQNLDECLRYYQKTYPYGTVAGTTGNGLRGFIAPSTIAAAYGPAQFFKPMAIAPIITLYNHTNGAINSVQDGGGVNHASAAALGVADSGFYGINFTTAVTAPMPVYCHYTASTGW